MLSTTESTLKILIHSGIVGIILIQSQGCIISRADIMIQ